MITKNLCNSQALKVMETSWIKRGYLYFGASFSNSKKVLSNASHWANYQQLGFY